ncbi:hypothetical protein SPRG_05971 [Saprolegnia parasitica CBS 223.65]|uniref:Uncharacterized protein n=1 Tax=Saprolegnia parasitica (strain CBS 223.65) TaxID=695850 RepID=A0A067CF90_SAPPC|nr:hypothetical protein SPRG_05971 [Saprolegnia parasitica CBS 223.65]KDO29434.1 hypothetical protein SPRG_05971 [Saprolegnia parasitica CBS 223.65]|eukprot:XP_012199934.1 hypothetical protein SPRG_05971 [Saprolegnia parasitica CBS 223.65]
MEWPSLLMLRDAVQTACFPRRPKDRDVSIHWVTRHLVALLQEYPDGITRPVALTELMVRYLQSHSERVMVGDRASETDVQVAELRQLIAARHTLVLDLISPHASSQEDETRARAETQMFIHQRFERFFSNDPATPHPFNLKRKLWLTNLRRLQSANDAKLHRYLPTDFMIFELSLRDVWDKGFLDHANCITALLQWQQMPPDTMHQQRFRGKVVDILAARPCVASGALRRQTILISPGAANAPTFLFVLWDQQTLLSQLLQPGDLVVIDCPFLLPVDATHSPEHRAILADVPPHSRVFPHIALEYGSSTVLFRTPATVQRDILLTQANETLDIPKEETTKFANLAYYPYPLQLNQLAPRSVNASLLGLVVDVKVSSASALLASFCATFYSSLEPLLCVELTICDWHRLEKPLQIECVGAVAATAVRCALGHVVFLDGVVLVEDPATMRRVVGLCAAWHDILGMKTSLLNGSLVNWSQLPGFLQSPSFYTPTLLSAKAQPASIVRATILDVGFLTPAGEIDATCELGGAVRMVHRFCRRPVALHRLGTACNFCAEAYVPGHEAAFASSFGDLLLQLDDGAASSWVLVHATCTEQLLGVDPHLFEQSTYAEQQATLAALRGQLVLGLLSLTRPRSFKSVQISRRLDMARRVTGSLGSTLYHQLDVLR